MRRTAIFFLKLMQQTVVTVRRALPTIPENRVIPFVQRRIEQGCVQHFPGESYQTTQVREIDGVPAVVPFTRIYIGAHQPPTGSRTIRPGRSMRERYREIANIAHAQCL
ncbi:MULTISPECIES: hypothetical protein [Paraburkholderia]|uniref:Uncharacterized protein n=2 Tax=Paraburkholderia TaxID=1822464 RepID=A0ABR7Q295_9BURK|nr:hypothetical protein [Paraburkholderia podalyriae]MBC8752675.1 hypothetical protein [Paraburkholderia podalyriae]